MSQQKRRGCELGIEPKRTLQRLARLRDLTLQVRREARAQVERRFLRIGRNRSVESAGRLLDLPCLDRFPARAREHSPRRFSQNLV